MVVVMDLDKLVIYYRDGAVETIQCRDFDFDTENPDILNIDIDDDNDIFICLDTVRRVNRTVIRSNNNLNYD
jgi:hypothetical protein